MSKKGINTREAKFEQEKPYCERLVVLLRLKIDFEWKTKYQKFGKNIENCQKNERFNSFCLLLRADMEKDLQAKHLKENPIGLTSLKGIVKEEKINFSDDIKTLLAVYLNFQDFEHFRQTIDQQSQNEAKTEKPTTQIISHDFALLPPNFFLRSDQNLLPLALSAQEIDLYHFFFQKTEQEAEKENVLEAEEISFEEINPQKRILKYGLITFCLLFLGSGYLFWQSLHWGKISLKNPPKPQGEMPYKALVSYQTYWANFTDYWIEYNHFKRYNDTLNQGTGEKEKMYYNAGIYWIKLKNRWKTVDSLAVYLPTKDWYMLVRRKDSPLNEAPYYQTNRQDFTSAGYLTLPAEYKMPISDLVFAHVQDYGASADRCTVEIRVKSRHSNTRLHLILQGSEVRNAEVLYTNLTFLKSAFLRTTGDTLKPKPNEYLPLEISLDTWQTLRFRTQKGILQTFLNQKLSAELPYRQKLGNLVGLQIHFERGAGMVDYVKVWNEKDSLVYEENFD